MTRARPTFAPWWQPWRWCWARAEIRDWHHGHIGDVIQRPRCRLPRRHHNRHACFDGFDVRYFDTPNEGTP